MLPPDPSTVRVLILDDNVDAVQAMVCLVEIWGYDVRGCVDSSSCVALAEEWQPHILLCDIAMPILDGFEVARRIRTIDALAETVLIAWTSFGAPEDRDRTRDAGFVEHLVKPVEPERLRAVLIAASPPPPA